MRPPIGRRPKTGTPRPKIARYRQRPPGSSNPPRPRAGTLSGAQKKRLSEPAILRFRSRPGLGSDGIAGEYLNPPGGAPRAVTTLVAWRLAVRRAGCCG
jgi:hypothetical protein